MDAGGTMIAKEKPEIPRRLGPAEFPVNNKRLSGNTRSENDCKIYLH
jgi:hypothetical protein